MSAESITIILPLPNRVLSPNFTVGSLQGRFMKAAAIKKRRAAAREAVESQAMGGAGWTAASAHATFYWPTARKRDIANAEGSLKADYDGIVDSGLIPGDHHGVLSHEPTTFSMDRTNPRVEIRLTRIG